MRAFLLAFALLVSAACRLQAAPALTDWLAAGYAEQQFDFAAAIDFYRQALETDPGNLKIQGRLMRMHVAAGDATASLELARTLDAALTAAASPEKEAVDTGLIALRLAVDAAQRADWQAAARTLEGHVGKDDARDAPAARPCVDLPGGGRQKRRAGSPGEGWQGEWRRGLGSAASRIVAAGRRTA